MLPRFWVVAARTGNADMAVFLTSEAEHTDGTGSPGYGTLMSPPPWTGRKTLEKPLQHLDKKNITRWLG